MKNKIQIKISNKGIYTLFAILVIIIVTAVIYAYNTQPPIPSNMGHSITEIAGACANDSGGCTFLNNYYTKGEVDGKIADIQGTCSWTGWNPPQDCGVPYDCIVPDCNLDIGSCTCDSSAPGYSINCCIHYPSKSCSGTYVEGYECTGGVITDHTSYYTGCGLVTDPSCDEFPV